MKKFRMLRLVVVLLALWFAIGAPGAQADGPTAHGTSCSRWYGGSADIHDWLWCNLIAYADFYAVNLTAW